MAEALKAAPEAREAWKAMRNDASLAEAAVAAIERSGALEREIDPRPRCIVEDLLTLLGKPGADVPGLELLLRAWRSAPQREVRLRAGRALLDRRETRGIDAVISRLDDVRGNERSIALQALFTRDPRAAFDALSPRFVDPSETAAVILYETLDTLLRDIQDDGKAHWGPSRGWFDADPRWRALCDGWRELPKSHESWGAKQAQGIVEIASWLRKRKRALV